MESTSLAEYLSFHNYESIELIMIPSGHLLIHASVNHVPGIFILDSGAGGTIIEATKIEKFKFQGELEPIAGAGAGGGGLAVYTSLNNHLSIGSFEIDPFKVSSMNFEHVYEGLKQLGVEEEIDGVLGADVLETGKGIIDYATKRLYLKSP